MPAAHVQISLPVQGVLRDVGNAFLGLCNDTGQKVLAAMMETDRIALCGPKGVPATLDALCAAAPPPAKSCWATST